MSDEDPRKRQRGPQTLILDAETLAKIAERNEREAEAKSKIAHFEEVEKRADMATMGGAAFGILGLVITAIGLLVKESIPIGTAGAVIGMVGFGIVTVAQYLKVRGRNGT